MGFKRIRVMVDLLSDEEYKKSGISNDKKFTRNRKINFKEMILFILNNKGKTLTLELNEYMTKQNKETITKQAFSKQRQNINPEIFKKLNNAYIKSIYEQREIKRYKGYIVLSVDGSMLELPNSKELKEYYGVQKGQEGSVGRVRGRCLGIYDSLNKIMAITRIDPYNVSEKKQIEEELKKIKEIYKNEKVIIVCDRFYFGISFINRLEKMGFKYLLRMRNNHYKKEKLEMESNDEIVDLKVRTNSVFYAETEEESKELKKLKKVKTRIIKTIIPSGEEEHLATNISKEELSEKEARELYYGRWEIEKAFDIIKNKVKIENFTSHKVIGVEQDFYSQMLLYNMLEDVKIDSGEIDQKEKNLKYEYKINMNIMVGIFREKFMDIIISPTEELGKKADEFNNEIKKYLVPIKPGRTYPRKKMHSMNKYRHNLRNNC